MKRLLVLSVLGAFAFGAYAADTKDTKAAAADAKNSQQEKMKMCNEKTKGMSKPEADKARSECMKGS